MLGLNPSSGKYYLCDLGLVFHFLNFNFLIFKMVLINPIINIG